MASTYTPTEGSTAARAVMALREFGGPMTTGNLCAEIGVEPKQVHQLLAAAITHGLIVRTTRISSGLAGGRQSVFSLPCHGIPADPPIYGDAQERAEDLSDHGSTRGRPPSRAEAKAKAPKTTPQAQATVPPAPQAATPAHPDPYGITYQPSAEPPRKEPGYWAPRLQALAAAPIRGRDLPTMTWPVERIAAVKAAVLKWRRDHPSAAEITVTRTSTCAVVQRTK